MPFMGEGAEIESSSLLGMVEGHNLFFWSMWSVAKRERITAVGSFSCCQTPELEFETA